MFVQDLNIQNFIDQNGQGQGELGSELQRANFDPGLLRPFIDRRGNRCVMVNTGVKEPKKGSDGKIIMNRDGTPELFPVRKKAKVEDVIANGFNTPIYNATTLRKDEWLQVDRSVIRAARQRLRAWADLVAANPVSGFDAMSKSILEYETMSDPGNATVDMFRLATPRNDQARFQLEGTPLPITSAGFIIEERKLRISRAGNTPLDTAQMEASGRRVGEEVEKTTIGTVAGMTYGTATDYGNTPQVEGYTTHPDRNTKTDMTAPDGTNGPTILGDWLALRTLLHNDFFYGPYMAYNSTDYDQYLDDLFSTSEPSAGTLRSRLSEIDELQGIRRLDFLTNTFTVLLIQMTENVARGINGMDLTTVQWETMGGAMHHFVTMAIHVPQLRADFESRCGIAHGTTA